MKYIKKFETSVYSEDIAYPQVYKISNINNYILHCLSKFKFKLDDCVKINKDHISYKYNPNVLGKIYIIKQIDLDNINLRYRISEITKEIYNKTSKFKFKEDDIWINEDHIIPVTTEEVEYYLISKDVNKYNL